jgi:hypothetical protein
MSGDALELALALHRAPIQRFSVRDRPLPDDIGRVIQLASAGQPLLQDTAARLCEPEATLLEAIRFYLQQVLFNPGTDAYRVLGLGPDAPAERIREHYHWLQRWLHPDRRGEDWEALFATRVNWAWQQLRSESARAAYDAEREEAEPSLPQTAAAPVAVGEWTAIPTAPLRASWPTRIALGVSVGSCLGLLYVALTRVDPLPLDEGVVGQRAARAVLRSQSASVESAPAIPASVPATTTAWPPLIPEPAESSLSAAPAPSAPEATLRSPEVAQGAAHAELEHLPQVAAAAPTLPVPMELRHAVPEPAAAPSANPERSRRITPNDPIMRAPAATLGARTDPAVGDRASATRSPQQAAPMQVARDERATSAVAAPDVNDSDALTRMDMASRRVADLCTYFSRLHTPPPPLWNDLQGQLHAEHARTALHERTGAMGDGHFEIDAPTWHFSRDAAALRAGYVLRTRRRVFESGHLSIAMVWRADMWLVTRVELHPQS